MFNRQVSASITTSEWPTSSTSPLCEAFAFLDSFTSKTDDDDDDDHVDNKNEEDKKKDENDFYLKWKFEYLSSLTEQFIEIDSYETGMEVAIESSLKSYPNYKKSESKSKLEGNLLSFSLATRAHAPQCEMYRSLSYHALSNFFNLDDEMKVEAFVIVQGVNDIIYTSVEEFKKIYKKSSIGTEKKEKDQGEGEDAWAMILPKEQVFFKDDDDEQEGKASQVFILYGQFHTKEFASFYNYFKKTKLPFVVRFMGDVNYDPRQNKDSSSSKSTKTTLQGYGVRVDIRNLEYKSFDEKEHDKTNEIQSTSSRTSADENEDAPESNIVKESLNMNVIKEKWMDGIDPEFLSSHSNNEEMIKFIQEYLPHLQGHLDNYHLPIIPPKSELENISLAATYVISDSVDPLWTLMQISQNLPSHAYALTNVTIPEEFKKSTKKHAMTIPGFARYQGSTGMFQFYVNGRRIYVERPSFNVFELLNTLKEENAFLNSVQSIMKGFLPPKAMGLVTSLLSMDKDSFIKSVDSKEDDSDISLDDDEDEDEILARMGIMKEKKLRIDVGRGWKGAIMYLNDIENDPEYYNWPTDIQNVLMGVQFGRPPSIRKNMITILLVIDPFNSNLEGYLMSLSLVFQMMQGMYPIRVGLLFASEQDIDQCREYIYINSHNEDGYCLDKVYQGKRNEVLKQDVSAQALNALLQNVLQTHGSTIGINYLYTMLQTMMQEKSTNMKIGILLKLHAQILKRFNVITSESEVLEILKTSEENNKLSVTYEKAIRFAVMKNIKPEMGFLNGVPFSTNDPSDVQEMIQDEMNYLLGMMMAGIISVSKKSSVYAKVLSGPNVYSQMHPLLNKEATYQLTPSYFDEETVSVLGSKEGKNYPKFLFEAVADFTTKEGVQFTKSFLSSIKKIIEKSDTKNFFASFRVLPIDVESAGTLLGKVFRQSHQFDLDELLLTTDSVSQAILDGKSVGGLQFLSNVEGPLKDKLEALLQESAECTALPWNREKSGTIRLNGRSLHTEMASLNDIELLMEFEYEVSKVISSKLSDFEQGNQRDFVATSRLASLIGQTFSSKEAVERTDTLSPYKDILDEGESIKKKRFHYTFNKDETDADDTKIKVTAILDPLSEATQRAAPLIKTLRDDFNLEVDLILIPRLEINEDSKLPISTYYRFVANSLDSLNGSNSPRALFQGLPANQVLTIRMDVPELWDIQQGKVLQDTDNLRCNDESCGDASFAALKSGKRSIAGDEKIHLTNVEYNLNGLLFSGQCYDVSDQSPPNGLQFTLSEATSTQKKPSSGTLVMKTIGYWQLQTSPGVWQLQIAESSRGSDIYEIVEGKLRQDGRVQLADNPVLTKRTLVMKDFVDRSKIVLVRRRAGFEDAALFDEESESNTDDDTINVFSLATGHLYERFLKIMMLSVTKRASKKVKFWFLENFLSPSFKSSAFYMAEQIGCEVEFITYKWPEWLRAQSEKQRIIWGYKILFLDVLFPLDLKKVIYVDADQVVRGDLQELVDLDLEGAPYGYTPMCDSNEETKGYQFWKDGFWPSHLRGRPYHISALYVVDLQRFRRELVGDQLRAVYQQLTADPNNLSNLDQDLPNYTQHQIKIHSLPQDWLWCESWCSQESKKTSKTIDLCNNPAHKEAKLSMAKRIISGELFQESWIDLDEEVAEYEKSYFDSLQ